MAEMSEKELKLWQGRLEKSHRLWKRHGMTGDSVGAYQSPFTYLSMYAGEHWNGANWAGISAEDLITVNMIFSNTNQLVARLSKRNPEPVVTARKKTTEQESAARIRKVILSYFIYELKMKRQIDKALMDALLTPFGIIRHGYTPPEEKFTKSGRMLDVYSFSRPDAPWIKRIPFWDFRVDPDADDFYPDGSARWCAFRDLVPERNFRETKSLIHRKDLRPTISGERQRIMGQSTLDSTYDGEDLVEVWWFWDKEERKRFALSPGSQKEVSEMQDWPVQYEDLPYDILMFNERAESNIPLPYPSVYESQQMELNKTRTLMSQLVKHLRRLLICNRNSFSDSERDKIEKGDLGLFEILMADTELQSAFQSIQVGGFPSDLLAYDATIKTDIRELIGLSNMDRGQRINVETATEAGGVQQGAEVIAGRNEEAFEAFWANILRHFNQSLDFTLEPGTVIPIVGEADAAAMRRLDGVEGSIEVDPAKIHGEFDVKVRARSTLPEDNDRDLAKLVQLKTIFQNDPTVKIAEINTMLIELAGFDSSRLVQTPEEQQATFENLRNEGVLNEAPQKNGGGGGVDANFLRMLGRQ